MQIVAYLTGSQDHVEVITPAKRKFLDPAEPAPAGATASSEEKKTGEAIAEWQKSEHVVLGCLVATAGKLHREAVLKHRQSGDPV
jgi:hypothetical protein